MQSLPDLSVPVFWRGADGETVDLTLTVSIGNRVLHRVRETLTGGAAGSRRQATFRTSLNRPQLAPGPHTLRVEARLGGRAVSRAILLGIR